MMTSDLGSDAEAGSDPGNPASTPVNIGVQPAGPSSGFALHGVRPNPFRTRTEVRFNLGRPGRVSLVVYDVMGREIRSLARGLWLEAGAHSLGWDGTGRDGGAAATGVYFVRLKTDGGRWTRSVIPASGESAGGTAGSEESIGQRPVDLDVGDAHQTGDARVAEFRLEDVGDLAAHALRDAFGADLHARCSCQSSSSAPCVASTCWRTDWSSSST